MIFDLEEVRFYDVDDAAMKKFITNIQKFPVKLTACKTAKEAVKGGDLITTCTADKKHQTVLTADMLDKPIFINGLAGDFPGKTEVAKEIVEIASVIVEYLPQSRIEGEIQQLTDDFIYPELHEIIKQQITMNVATGGTILYDSVGCALEDYSVLRLVYKLAKSHNIGTEMQLIPQLDDVKNLYSLSL